MKTLLITYPRTGSTVLCEEYIKFFNENSPYPILEPYNKDYYSSERSQQSLLNVGIDIRRHSWNKTVARKVFLRSLNKDEFIIKYMVDQQLLDIPLDVICHRCKKNKVEVYSLHRKSLEDVLVSYFLATYRNIWQRYPGYNSSNYSDIPIVDEMTQRQFVLTAIEQLVNARQLFFIITNYFKKHQLLVKEYVYEDDIITKKFLINEAIPPRLNKISEHDHKFRFYKANPWIETLILQAVNQEQPDRSDY